jgi:hypothetical protein
MKEVIIGVYRHDSLADGGAGKSRLVKKIDGDTDLKTMLRNRAWKNMVKNMVADVMGSVEILSISVVHGDGDLDVNVAVTIDQKPPAFGQRKKATTRGGRPIGSGPIKTGKTMAAKRRSGK